MEPVCLENASEALSTLRDAQTAGRPFDLLLTAAELPGTDGFTLVKEIRDQRSMANIDIMMLDCRGVSRGCSSLSGAGCVGLLDETRSANPNFTRRS